MEDRFWEPEPNVIESSGGFSVRVLGRTGMRYMEGDRSVWINSEVLAGPLAIALYKGSIKSWDSPGGSEQLSNATRNRIAENIKRAFESCGYELHVIGD